MVVSSKLVQMKHAGIEASKLDLPIFSFCRLIVDCSLSGVSFGCRVYLSVVVVCCWLSGVACGVLTVDCRGSRCKRLLLVPGYNGWRHCYKT